MSEVWGVDAGDCRHRRCNVIERILNHLNCRAAVLVSSIRSCGWFAESERVGARTLTTTRPIGDAIDE